MTLTLLITPELAMDICTPFQHHGEDVDDELEVAWRLPAHRPPDPDSLRPEFVPPWRPGGDKIRPDVKAQWCAALRSGKYRQIFGYYRDGSSNGHCALHVLYAIAREAGWESVIAWTGVSDRAFNTIANIVISLNDVHGMPFPEIADYIERTY